MPNEAPSLAPRRGPDGRFTSGVQEKIQQPTENDDVELLDLTDEEMVEEEPTAPKKPSPPKITREQLQAADERRAAARAKDKTKTTQLQKNIREYDPSDPMHPVRVEEMNARPKRALELRARKIKAATENLDPMDKKRISMLKDPMHPTWVEQMNKRPEKIDEMTFKWVKEMEDAEDPMHPDRIARIKLGRAQREEFAALRAENKILEYINALKSEYAAKYGADLDAVSRGHETIGESFRAWRKDIRPGQGIKAMLKGIGSLFGRKESLEETLKSARSAKDTKEYYITEYDQAQTELAQSKNARRLGKKPKVSERYYEEE